MAVKRNDGARPRKLYRTIREVSELLDVKPHVLRYWETQFPTLRPRKNRAGNRMYRPEEVRLLARIKELLYARRFTIEGARRQILEERRGEKAKPAPALGGEAERRLELAEVREELRRLAQRLRRAAARGAAPA